MHTSSDWGKKTAAGFPPGLCVLGEDWPFPLLTSQIWEGSAGEADWTNDIRKANVRATLQTKQCIWFRMIVTAKVSRPKKTDSQLCTAWTWRQTGSVPRLHGGGGSRWDFQRGFWLKAYLESLEWSVMLQALPSYLTTKYINVCLKKGNFRKYIYQGIVIITSGTVFPTLNWCFKPDTSENVALTNLRLSESEFG